jgi:PAS domain-containing protein
MKTSVAPDNRRKRILSKIHRLSARVAQLEADNVLLDETISRNSRLFAALLSNGRQGITLTGPDRRIVRVVKGLTGIDPTSLCGQLVDSLAVPEDREIIAAAYRRLLDDRCGTTAFKARFPRADEAIGVYEVTLNDMLDNPDVQGIVWNYSEAAVREPSRLNQFDLRSTR